jgi:hypothetical protein
MTDKEKKKVPNYVISQWTGDNPPRVQPPEAWIEQEGVTKYDTIKFSFEVVLRHKDMNKEK